MEIFTSAGDDAVVGCFFMALASAFEWLGCGCSHRHALALAHASGVASARGGFLPQRAQEAVCTSESAEDEGASCRRGLRSPLEGQVLRRLSTYRPGSEWLLASGTKWTAPNGARYLPAVAYCIGSEVDGPSGARFLGPGCESGLTFPVSFASHR